MVLPLRKHTTYGHPRSSHVFIFRREVVFQGAGPPGSLQCGNLEQEGLVH
jgi:hypothetical protein